MSRPDYRLREFGVPGAKPAPAAELAALHAELLDHSPLVLMGPEFVEQFYYSVLPAENLIHGVVAYVDDRPAGFIVATGDPDGFMSKATKRHSLRIAWIMLKSVLRSPRRLAAIREARAVQKNVQVEAYGPEMGEMLSFGVLPQYRSRSFVRQTTIQVGADLLAGALRQLAATGKKRARAIVDKDNLEAQLFYRFHGWRLGLADVKGWRVPTMEFLFDIDAFAFAVEERSNAESDTRDES